MFKSTKRPKRQHFHGFSAMTTAPDLAAHIEQFATRNGSLETPIPRLTLFRAEAPTEPIHLVYNPAFCFIAQGAKHVMMGDRDFSYDPARYLIISVDVPIVSHITEASPAAPYLSMKLDLDPAAISALMLETGLSHADAAPAPSLQLSTASPDLLDACARMVRLLANPQDAPVLAPLIEREILYRLLTSEQGPRLRQIAQADSRLTQIQRAIFWIKENYAAPFRIEDVAAAARMSASALHQHFKTVTAMSPLQYQKQLRLQEARTLILSRGMDAAQASLTVGYESPSQFSREYKRLFGDSPLRDVARLRETSESARAAAA